jgi:hypothetical protein
MAQERFFGSEVENFQFQREPGIPFTSCVHFLNGQQPGFQQQIGFKSAVGVNNPPEGAGIFKKAKQGMPDQVSRLLYPVIIGKVIDLVRRVAVMIW